METSNNNNLSEGLVQSFHEKDKPLTTDPFDTSESHAVLHDLKPALLEGIVSENLTNLEETESKNEDKTNIGNIRDIMDSDQLETTTTGTGTSSEKQNFQNSQAKDNQLPETKEEKDLGIQSTSDTKENTFTETKQQDEEDVLSEPITPVPVPVVEEVEIKRDPNLVSITLRPMDQTWVMGEDWIVDFHNLATLISLREYIEQKRGISRHRIQLRLKGKVLPLNREIWTLRRLGIYDGYVIIVEPTLTGSWLWESKEYYINKLLKEINQIISLTNNNRINLKELNKQINMPPCIKTSLRVFLRQYPEYIYIHTDITNNELYIHNNTTSINYTTTTTTTTSSKPISNYQLPTFHHESIDIGYYTYYKPKYYNWMENKDIDDMYKLETLPPEEETKEEKQEENTTENIDEKERIDEKKELSNEEEAARLVAISDEDNDNNSNDDNISNNSGKNNSSK